MRTNKSILFMMLGAAMLTTSCISEERDWDEPLQTKTGALKLNLNADAAFATQTRALNEAAYRNTNNYTVQLINVSNEAVLMECQGSELEDKLPKTLEIGSYEIKAFYGNEYDASRTGFRVEGSKSFTIAAEQTTQVEVDCAPTCGKVTVAFASEMSTYYSNYSVTFGGTAALGTKTFAWAKADTDPWYVAIGTSAERVTYTVNLIANDDYVYVDGQGNKSATGSVTGSFTLERNKAQKLTVSPVYNPPTEGGLSITITIDDTTNDRPVTIEVPVSWI